jgi:hypothetical protein
MTEKQREYARHRAAGLPPTAAARAAGYRGKGVKVTASRLDRNPKVRAAIEEARQAARGSRTKADGVPRYDPEGYLRAVIAGSTPADPIRVSAAKALLPFLEPRRRSPKGNAISPREQEHLEELEAEREASEAWQATVARIKAGMKEKS